MSCCFNWYEVVKNDEPLTQGDILFNCPVVDIRPIQSEPFVETQLVDLYGAIVMTQACDLEHGKVDNINLCSLTPFSVVLKEAMEKQNLVYDAKSNKEKERKKDMIFKFLNGQFLSYHILDKPGMEICEDYLAVNLRESYTMPYESLNLSISGLGENRIRLLPPYREHLSQAYARLFMRIGLPSDIEIYPENI